MAQGPRRKLAICATKRKNFLGYLIVIYIGKQTTDIYAIRYHTSTVHAGAKPRGEGFGVFNPQPPHTSQRRLVGFAQIR